VETIKVVDGGRQVRYVNLLRHRPIPSPNTEIYTLHPIFEINVELS
jgi:hypothetical protein